MRKFKDKDGVEWELSVDMQSAMAIKTETGVDILDIAEGKDLVLLTSDIVTLGAVLWLLVSEQAEKRGLDAKAFFRKLDGDAIDAATTTLVAECFDFFPPQKRSLLKIAYDRVKGLESRGIQKGLEILEKTTDDQLETIVTGRVSDLKQPPESPSSPGDSLSAS